VIYVYAYYLYRPYDNAKAGSTFADFVLLLQAFTFKVLEFNVFCHPQFTRSNLTALVARIEQNRQLQLSSIRDGNAQTSVGPDKDNKRPVKYMNSSQSKGSYSQNIINNVNSTINVPTKTNITNKNNTSNNSANNKFDNQINALPPTLSNTTTSTKPRLLPERQLDDMHQSSYLDENPRKKSRSGGLITEESPISMVTRSKNSLSDETYSKTAKSSSETFYHPSEWASTHLKPVNVSYSQPSTENSQDFCDRVLRSTTKTTDRYITGGRLGSDYQADIPPLSELKTISNSTSKGLLTAEKRDCVWSPSLFDSSKIDTFLQFVRTQTVLASLRNHVKVGSLLVVKHQDEVSPVTVTELFRDDENVIRAQVFDGTHVSYFNKTQYDCTY